MKQKETIQQKPIVVLYSTGHDWPFPLCDLLRAYYPGYQVKHIAHHFKNGAAHEVVNLSDIVYYSHFDPLSGILMTGKEHGVCRSRSLTESSGSIGADEKNTIKRELYHVLSAEFGALPWGMLTGVRPSSLLFNMEPSQLKQEQQIMYLETYYGISQERAELAVSAAAVELPIIREARKAFSLYIHIPFCPSRCDYCSFPTLLSVNRQEEIRAYADQLIWEMREMSSAYADWKLQNVYVGGGIPATMSVSDLHRVLSEVSDQFDTSDLKEITVEVGRPELVTEELLTMLVSHNVNRISINPQTMQQKTLDMIGRRHSVEDVFNAFSLTRKFSTIAVNLDLIIGLPGEGKTSFLETLQQVEKLDPENLTMHTMSIKKGSVYGQLGIDSFSVELKRIRELCDLGRSYAKTHGYTPYYLYRQKNMVAPLENVGYTKPDHINRYNVLMMEEKHFVLGIGMGATSKFPNSVTNGVKTILNYRNLRDYMGKSNLKVSEKKRAMKEIVY